MKFNKRSSSFFSIATLLVSLILLTGCSSNKDLSGISITDYANELSEVAGTNATDCGWVKVGEEREVVDSCVELNLRNKKPFYATYDRQGIDSRISSGIAFNKQGEVYSFNYDSNPSGGISSNDGRIIKSVCDTVPMDLNSDTDIEDVKTSCESVFSEEEVFNVE